MKLFGKLIISLAAIATIVGGATVATYILLNDDETTGFKYDSLDFTIENELANDLDTSLKTIKDTNYETNSITVDLTMEQLNAFIVKTAQSKINENYLKDDDHQSLYDNGKGFRVDCLYFASEGENIHLYACIGYKNIIKTAARLSADLTIQEGNKLVVSLTSIKVGKYINLNSGSIKSLLNGFKSYLSTTNIDGLDLENMTYTIDLNKVIHDALEDNKFIRDMLCAFDYSAKIEDGSIKLSIDSSKIFTGHRNRTATTPYIWDVQAITTQLATDGYVTIAMTESEFNDCAYDDLNESLGNFKTGFELGSKTFTLSCNEPYYSINNGEVETSFSINGVESMAAFIADITQEKNNDDSLAMLDIHAELASVGELKFGEMGSEDGFAYDFQIDPKDLIPVDGVKIKNFEVIKDETNPRVTFSVSLS